MATRMLIDARHPEETRVAVLKGNRIEEFDFESADRKQLKGNIYLAKVTRVEPSLQAAFVDFGGNRHGFLAFSEIHPDYYQIPKEDREALLAEEAAHAEEEAALRAAEEAEEEGDVSEDDGENELDADDDGGLTEVDTSELDEVSTIEAGHVENGDDEDSDDGANVEDSDDDDAPSDRDDDVTDEDRSETEEADEDASRPQRRGRRRQGRARSKEADDLRARRIALRRRYKIQDVIQRRQVLLVQVVKEERGNKGAALTTYLSLAGRYCVLMPNSSHGGGISRKINSVSDRKRLKSIISELNLPKTMGCIVRTAGLSRTKTEIKRDFDYLARLWDELRENTLKSSAPALIHSDSDLIKRAIRDIYNRDIEEVVVEGEEGYRAAKDFMKLLMPSHARRVKPYSDPVPLFQRYGAEDQLTAMYDPVVQLKSGGYIVINPTEALVSIDINSGRSTKEHGIEATAVNTNLEAAREIARQLRLRDMAGLVVIDFIDMEYGSNVRKVEKAMKDALKSDRARIQVGRISSFGLMEMSRQRLRTGVLESTTRQCPHCDGTGLVRTASSAGLSALRLIEDEAAKGKGSIVTLYASTEAAVYLLNSKRSDLADIEARYGVSVEVIPEGENEGAKMRVTSSGPRVTKVPRFEPIIEEEDDDDDFEEEAEFSPEEEVNEESGNERKRRRKRRRGGRGRGRGDAEPASEETEEAVASDEDAEGVEVEASDETAPPKKRRRRGGRRRRGRGGNGEATDAAEGEQNAASDDSDQAEALSEDTEAPKSEESAVESTADAPASRRRRRKKTEIEETESGPEFGSEDTTDTEYTREGDETSEKPRKRTRKQAKPEKSLDEGAEEASADTDEGAEPKPKRTRRKKAEVEAESDAPEANPSAESPPEDKPRRTRRKKTEASEADAEVTSEVIETAQAVETSAASEPAVEAEAPAGENAEQEPPRRGWWQRTFGE